MGACRQCRVVLLWACTWDSIAETIRLCNETCVSSGRWSPQHVCVPRTPHHRKLRFFCFLLNFWCGQAQCSQSLSTHSKFLSFGGDFFILTSTHVKFEYLLGQPTKCSFLSFGSCIPLYNFSYTYEYIMSTPTSFVDRSAN